jgi:hypothetical protein
MARRCDCECHIPGRQVMHFEACCYSCAGCDEQRILFGTAHKCDYIHLGCMTAQGVELKCGEAGPFLEWVSSKHLPRKVSKVPQGDRASVFFSLKLEKASCPVCKVAAKGLHSE